jgi:NAD+ synthase (glutamine-hydrolysing)
MVMPKLRLALAQTNPIVGDIEGNIAKILAVCSDAASQGVALVLFGEMSVTGYPIEDLATREHFVAKAQKAVETLAIDLKDAGLGSMAVVVGHPRRTNANDRSGWAIANNYASVLLEGAVLGGYAKTHLPNYSVFDEYRNFVAGTESFSFEYAGMKIGLLICEDIWQHGPVVQELKKQNCDLTLVLNGSPFEIDKDDRRLQLVRQLAQAHGSHVAYVNLVGGQDDLVFDGDSLFVSPAGDVMARGKQFEGDLIVVDFDTLEGASSVTPIALKQDDDWQAWNALVVGLRDYCHKNDFKSVVLGLSGGIDSAVCAVLAADAIGAANVFGVSMPSEYSSDHSKSDAADLAHRVGLHYQTIAIAPMVAAFEESLTLGGVASENLQARVRGVILMGLSNAQGHLTLTTGNKTELAVGYSTIYGDSVGGFAPIKDVEKTLVWRLAKWRNSEAVAKGEVAPIPQNSINKPPSAELRPGQVDQDTLPEYAILDALLGLYVNERKSVEQIVAAGFEESLVKRIVGLIDKAEWKRRQSAIGPKITGMAFGKDRRLPVTNKNKE